MAENDNDNDFTDNTHAATTFQEASERFIKVHVINQDDKLEIYSDQKNIFGKTKAVIFTLECKNQIKSWQVVEIDGPDEAFSVECDGDKLFLCSLQTW